MNRLRPRISAFPIALLALGFGALAFGCDDTPPPPKKTSTASAAAPQTTSASSSDVVKPKGMPELLVDAQGPYLAGRRVDLSASDGRDKLVQIVKDLPIQGSPVTLIAEKRAKTPHVAAVVTELGRAGAPKVIIKTDGRDDVPKQLAITPDSRVSAPAGCAVATMVLKDFSTAVWAVSGGVGKRQRKGFAGPDLSVTGEILKKDLGGCDSTLAF